MKNQKTVYPMNMTETAMEKVFDRKVKLDYLSKKQVLAIVRIWEARKASQHLYFYLCTSTTNRVRIYCALRDKVTKAKTIACSTFIDLAASLKEVEKEMKFRGCYPRVPSTIHAIKWIRW